MCVKCFSTKPKSQGLSQRKARAFPSYVLPAWLPFRGQETSHRCFLLTLHTHSDTQTSWHLTWPHHLNSIFILSLDTIIQSQSLKNSKVQSPPPRFLSQTIFIQGSFVFTSVSIFPQNSVLWYHLEAIPAVVWWFRLKLAKPPVCPRIFRNNKELQNDICLRIGAI